MYSKMHLPKCLRSVSISRGVYCNIVGSTKRKDVCVACRMRLETCVSPSTSRSINARALWPRLKEGRVPDYNEIEEEESLEPTPFHKCAVASDNEFCSAVGRDVMCAGGNAVDAAIATLLCNGLASVQSMGIGGGFFMTIYDRDSGLSTTIDAREAAPALANSHMFDGIDLDADKRRRGSLSIAVPAEIKGYWYAHNKYGRLPWRDLFQPAIRMAEGGFPVNIALRNAMIDARQLIFNEPSLRSVFYNDSENRLYKLGERIRDPQLAQTLRIISEEGESAFYNGSLTDTIIQDIQDMDKSSIYSQRPCKVRHSDLNNYKVIERPPLETTLKNGLRVLSTPPPGAGLVLVFILHVLEGYDLTPDDISSDEKAARTYHRFLETMKFATAKTREIADEDFVDISQLKTNFMSKEFASVIATRISDEKTQHYEYYEPTFYTGPNEGTSHTSVIDQDGMAVSVTSSISGRFGCGMRGMRTGIIFNNSMYAFRLPIHRNQYGEHDGEANIIESGKRPIAFRCPAIFLNPDGSVSKVLGAAGGSLIASAVAWVLMHNLWLGKGLRASINEPRLHHHCVPVEALYERGFNKNVLKSLHKDYGHDTLRLRPFSVVNAINVKDGVIFADSDFRKAGKAAGV